MITFVMGTVGRLKNTFASTLPGSKRSVIPMPFPHTDRSPYLNNAIHVCTYIYSCGTRAIVYTDTIKVYSDS